MKRLLLKPGPRLIALRFDDGEDGDEGGWLEEDVTELACEWLFDPVSLEPGVTLADLMGLLERSPVLKLVYRRWRAAELSAEALLGPLPQDPDKPEDAIEYLELGQHWSLDPSRKAYEDPTHRLTVTGVGVVQARDRPESFLKAGQRIEWSVKTSRLRTLLPLPVRLSDEVTLWDSGRQVVTLGHPYVTLGEVLYSLLWELSFFGAPEQLQALADLLHEAVEEDGEPWEEVPPGLLH